MDYENVNETPDDLSVEEVVEEEVDTSETLDSLEEPEEEPKAKAEPGYVRGRIEKAVQKVRDEYDQKIAQMQAMFDEQMAPLKARLLEDEAQELVRSKKISDIETAREYVRMRNGVPAPVEEPQSNPAIEARIAMLEHQADMIRENNGPDVINAFQNDKNVNQKVVSGEWDFYDVAKHLANKKRPPSPMRSPNGATGTNPNAIEAMSDEQFARMEKRIKEGARYSLR